MVVQGMYRSPSNPGQIQPDMGYSFCNCKNVFYTNYDNLNTEFRNQHPCIKNPLTELRKQYDELKIGYCLSQVLPDPFFVEWGKDPHTFLHWDVRHYHIIWDMEQYCKEAREIGFEVVSAERNFDIDSENQQTFRVHLRKPVDKNDPLYTQMFTPETKLRAASQAAKDHFGDKPVTMVEVGVLRGDYSALQLREWDSIEKIHLIDKFKEVWDIPNIVEHNENYRCVVERFEGNNKTNLIIGDSADTADEFEDASLDYVYVDADHLYHPVMRDVLAWLPKVKKNGIIGGHDWDYSIRPSVKEAVTEIFGDDVQYGENQNTLWDWWVVV